MSAGPNEMAGLRLDDLGRVGVVTLERPPVNALASDILTSIGACFERPCRYFPEARALVLVAEGPHFSAGHDRMEQDLRHDPGFLQRAVGELAAVQTCPAPVVAGVQGGAIGTGFILAACADILIIEPDGFVALPEVELSMLGGAGHAARWLPPALVRDLVLLGRRVSGATLHAAGLASAPDQGVTVRDAAIATARILASRPPDAVAAARAVLADLEEDVVATHRDEMRRAVQLDRKIM